MDLLRYKKNDLKKTLLKSNFKRIKKKLFFKKNILIFNKVYEKFVNDLVKHSKNQFKKKPRFTKPSIYCKDIVVFNKNIKKSKVRGFYKKLLLFPWQKKNLKFFKKIDLLFKLKKKFELKDNDLNYFNNNHSYVIQVMYYPKKSGYLSRHVDSVTHKDCIIQINSNLKKTISKSGGLNIDFKKKNLKLDQVTSKGDVIIFSKGIKHFVEKDDYNSRWSIIVSSVKF